MQSQQRLRRRHGGRKKALQRRSSRTPVQLFLPTRDGLVPWVYVIVLSLFGGAAPEFGLGSVLIALSSAAAIIWLIWSERLGTLRSLSIWAKLALAGMILLPLVQIMPLPPHWWQAMPGEETRVGVLSMINAANSWQPYSLEPLNTAYTLAMALGFVAFVLGVSGLSDDNLRAVFAAALLVILLGMLIGVAQVASGGFPVLYRSTHQGALIGLLANKNHMGLMIAISISITFLLVAELDLRRSHLVWAVSGYIALALPCVVATNSRAGLGLGVISAAIVILALMHNLRARYRVAIFLGGVALGMLVITSPAFDSLFDRFNSVDSDGRWQILQQSRPLIDRYWRMGSGGGSYASLFLASEKLAWVRPSFPNHFHDDYLEILIEYGVAAWAVLLLTILAIGHGLWLGSKNTRSPFRRRALWVAAMVIGLIGLHSWVDYPLRRPACNVVFAVALGTVIGGGRRWRLAPDQNQLAS